MPQRITWVVVGGLAALWILATAALPHRGWTWAEEEQTELTGTIAEIYIGPPHPTLEVAGEDGQVWTIELGKPRLTAASGFTGGVSALGDAIVVLGHRALDASDIRMKAVRITIDGAQYDIYPDLIETEH